jgi:UDP-N-acetylmuramoyl-L-alanyl-D-glutamate--2,6-diaminopimelate ligase
LLPLDRLLAGTTILRTNCDAESLSIPVHPWQLSNKFFFKWRSARIRRSAAEAIERGFQYVVLGDGDEEEGTLPADVKYLIVDNVNRAFARACSRNVGDVHRQLSLIGVTGTSRTTVCHLIDGALRASGVRSGLFSSLVYRLPESELPGPGPVALPFVLHNFLLELHRQGGTHAHIEISAADVAEERLFGLQFDALAFTGGGSIEEAGRLFTDAELHKSPATLCAFNVDDPIGRELADSSSGRVVTFGFNSAGVTPDAYSTDAAGITLHLHGRELRSPLVGRHNARNLLAAAAIVDGITGSEDACFELRHVALLPGRLDKLPTPIGVDVYVHSAQAPAVLTAESVNLALAALREIAGSRRIVSLVACSGKSDKARRPLIARAAMNGSDLGILTSGDPGPEHPASIVMGMLSGLPRSGHDRVKTIIDRRTAIDAAIREALPDGVAVLFSEENGQQSSDRHVALQVLHELAASG